MRVTCTCAVRQYVRKAVLDKVADRIKKAEEDAAAAAAALDAKVDEAAKLCERLCAEAQAKFVKEAKKIGLTFIPDIYSWNGVDKNANKAINADVGRGDFVETMTSRGSLKAKCNPCAARDEFDRVMGEPDRIRSAANAAADRLLFELELGKVAKKELDEALKCLEVKL